MNSLLLWLQVVGLSMCQKTMGTSGRARQVQPLADLAQVSDAATKLASLLDQVEKCAGSAHEERGTYDLFRGVATLFMSATGVIRNVL